MSVESIDEHVIDCNSTIILEECSSIQHGAYVGCVKWFSNSFGYGFATIYSDGELKGRDVFVHHTGIRPLNSNYRTLQKGEYISFDIENSASGKQAVNVTGVFGGPLMCDQRSMPGSGGDRTDGRPNRM